MTNGNGTIALNETLNDWVRTGDVALLERISELELALENAGWVRALDTTDGHEFSLDAIKKIAHQARLYYLKNPLIQRGVNVQADYTFGRGVPIKARDEEINAVLQRFVEDPKNQVELTSHSAMLQKDKELDTDGNLFLVFFVHEVTGSVRVRSIPLFEIEEIITNPDDRKEPWYYLRVWQETTRNLATGEIETNTRKLWYKDWQYAPDNAPEKIAGVALADGVVYHIKTGGFSDWLFGVSGQYAALDWARAYKTFLENWATLMQAYARFAAKVRVKGGSRAVQSVKSKLASTLSTQNVESNPPATTGAVAVEDADNATYEIIKTAGATSKAEEGRRLMLMVAAAQNLPETFYGDVSVGTLATAESLDRPTELHFSNRQELWQSVLRRITWFVVECSVKAPRGELKGNANVTTNEYGEEVVTFPDEYNTRIDVEMPEIISMSIKDRIASIISAASLDGKQITLFNDRIITEWILQALGVDEPEKYLEELEFNDDQDPRNTSESGNLARSINRLVEVFNANAARA